MKIKNGKLPQSNYGPCHCNASADSDMSEYIPDRGSRPVRKEVDASAIGSNMKYSDKGYKPTRLEREDVEDDD
jgi:hypothetical protein